MKYLLTKKINKVNNDVKAYGWCPGCVLSCDNGCMGCTNGCHLGCWHQGGI